MAKTVAGFSKWDLLTITWYVKLITTTKRILAEMQAEIAPLNCYSKEIDVWMREEIEKYVQSGDTPKMWFR